MIYIYGYIYLSLYIYIVWNGYFIIARCGFNVEFVDADPHIFADGSF